MNIYYKKIKGYSGTGEAKNKQGDWIKGTFKIDIFSNGKKEIIFHPTSKKILFNTLKMVKKKSIFHLKGKNNKGKLFTGKLHLIQTGKSFKFLLLDFVVSKGKFKRGEKDIYYFIDNMVLGKLRYNPIFHISNKKYSIHPYNYNNLKGILRKYGGRQTTGLIHYKSNSQYISNKNKTIIFRLLTLLSFFTANYIHIFKIEIKQNKTFKEIYFDDKCYPFNKDEGIIDFTFLPISKVIESTFDNFDNQCNKIEDFSDLIEEYIEGRNVVVIENKLALISILFEGLKSRYIKSNIINKYKQDNNGNYLFIRRGRRRRRISKSFKDLLAEIFTLEKFRYSKKELDSLIKIRSLVIHEAKAKSREKNISYQKAIKTYYEAISMFERFMLRILKYKGSYLHKTHNKGYIWRTIK